MASDSPGARGTGLTVPPSFSAPAREWFAGALGAPTQAQLQAWEAIAAGHHALVIAPTGSGKTLAAFFWAIDSLMHVPPRTRANARCRVLYISPLKALAADVERNLRLPLAGIKARAPQLAGVSVAMRTGDTPQSERRSFAKAPADILITTPESLYLLLTSQARDALRGVECVIVDELHSLLPTKRGAHLALSLERLDELTARPCQRIGLSATIEPPLIAARFLTGTRPIAQGGREVTIASPPTPKALSVRIEVPLPDLTNPADRGSPRTGTPPAGPTAGPTARPAGQPGPPPPLPAPPGLPAATSSRQADAAASVWQPIAERIVTEAASRRATLVFANSRRSAERLAARLNEEWARRQGAPVPEPGALLPAAMPAQSGSAAGLAGVFARAHHGSMSALQRREIEAALKAGRLPCVVATSTLELGIDMGAIDLVIMLGVPPSVSSGLQRLGRAGHQVGAESTGTIFPLHPGELLPAAVIAGQIAAGSVEEQHWPSCPLDVLAQHLVAMCAMEPWPVEQAAALVRRSAPFETLGEKSFTEVVDMLSGRYPSEDFAALKPRLIWDHARGVISARPGARQLAVLSGGTIPDAGLYGVFVAGDGAGASGRGGRRVGELDEEMVYESRVGDRITLGTTTWRIAQITPDRVVVDPAPGEPGRLPFWKGDTPGRLASLSRAIGAEARTLAGTTPEAARERLAALGLNEWAQDNLLRHLQAQGRAAALPHDKRVVIESFSDDAGDRRIVIHSLFGGRVNAPWALLIAGQMAARLGFEPQYLHADDGIVLHLPAGGAEVLDGDLLPEAISPAALTHRLAGALAASPQFAARFRQAAARALLLPRAQLGKRQPLWQQRHRAASLLAAAAKYPAFPLVHEAVRECLQDDWDIDSLAGVLAALAAGTIEVVHVTSAAPSPFARTLMLAFTGAYLYDGDMPLAEQRATALALDPDLLAELVGGSGPQLAEIVPPGVAALLSAELERRAEGYRLTSAEALFDWVRVGGPITLPELTAASEARGDEDAGTLAAAWVGQLRAAGRLIDARIGAGQAVIVPTDAGRVISALGPDAVSPVQLAGLPPQDLAPVPGALGQLAARLAQRRLVLRQADVAGYLGAAPSTARAAIGDLVREGALLQLAADAVRVLDPVSPPGPGFASPGVLQRLRRRSLAQLRRQIRPASAASLAAFLAAWHHLGEGEGEGGTAQAISAMAGARVPASALESLVLPARVPGFEPGHLDELVAAGEVIWCGQGEIAGHDGYIRLLPADGSCDLLATASPHPDGELEHAITRLLGGGALFAHEIAARLGQTAGPGLAGTTVTDVAAALWRLAWSGWVTSDSMRALRAYLLQRSSPARPQRQAQRVARRTGSLRSAALRSAALRSAALRATDLVLAPGQPAAPGGGGTRLGGARVGGEMARDLVPGRWSLTPAGAGLLAGAPVNATARAHATAVALAERFGVITGAACTTESSLAELYPVFAALEESGALRRGYFVEHAGGAQFALPAAVGLLREPPETGLHLLSAADPASPYGLQVPWPEAGAGATHRPARRAGACVVTGPAGLIAYLEAGGGTMLTFPGCQGLLPEAASVIVSAVRNGRIGPLTLRTLDALPALQARAEGTELAVALVAAGFVPGPSGLRARP